MLHRVRARKVSYRCRKMMAPPSSTFVSLQNGSTGTLSFYDIWNAKSVETTAWEKEGFDCTPLQKTTIHGFSTQWSYDECVAVYQSRARPMSLRCVSTTSRSLRLHVRERRRDQLLRRRVCVVCASEDYASD